MKLFLSQNHSDEEGGFVKQGKLGVLVGQKSDIYKLSEFLNQVVKHLEKNDTCHMHFRDSFREWNREDFIDLEINVE